MFGLPFHYLLFFKGFLIYLVLIGLHSTGNDRFKMVGEFCGDYGSRSSVSFRRCGIGSIVDMAGVCLRVVDCLIVWNSPAYVVLRPCMSVRWLTVLGVLVM